MSGAPLLTHALPGLRTWMLAASGTLVPYTGQVGPWEPGVNTAQCSRGAAHTAPAEDCTCGIYAFHHMSSQLRREPVVGAIAAWGDLDVYRDGFRAQHATVLALAGRRTTALVRAAAHYGVPIVPRAALQPLAQLLTGALPASLVEGGGPEWLARRRGFDDQVWVEPAAGEVTLGISVPLREWLGRDVKVDVTARDDRRVAVRLRGTGGEVTLPAHVRGHVREINPAPEPAPGDPEGGCWIARVGPTDWEEDCRAFAWGAAARDAMLADSWEHLTEGDGAVSSWRDVKAMLDALREPPPPRFATPAQLYDELAIPLGQALGRDRSLTRLDVVLAFETTAPEARIVLDLRTDAGRLHTTRGPVPDVEVTLKADDLVATLLGELDLARESRTGRLRVRGSLAHALSSLAIVSAWARPRLNGVTAVLTG